MPSSSDALPSDRVPSNDGLGGVEFRENMGCKYARYTRGQVLTWTLCCARPCCTVAGSASGRLLAISLSHFALLPHVRLPKLLCLAVLPQKPFLLS